jgi:hypothetical protein
MFLSVCIVLWTVVIGVAVNQAPLLKGDEWDHNGYALQIEKRFPVTPDGRAMSNYPWWYSVFIITFSQLSGLPQVNALASLGLLGVMPLVGLLGLFKKMFGNSNNIPNLGVIMQLFAGYGWLAVIVANQSDYYSTIFSMGNYTYDLWVQNGAFALIVSRLVKKLNEFKNFQ